MQTNIQGLDELARQSKINYTVVSQTPYLEYFENMASAEEELYLKWKELHLMRQIIPANIECGITLSGSNTRTFYK